MARIVVRPQADDDLFEIAAYIARDNRTAAERLIDALESKFTLLAISPRLGRLRPELAPGLRSLPFRNYVIFYQPLQDGIEVVRVLHGKRETSSPCSSHDAGASIRVSVRSRSSASALGWRPP
jgi:toxin ParE1/3/4